MTNLNVGDVVKVNPEYAVNIKGIIKRFPNLAGFKELDEKKSAEITRVYADPTCESGWAVDIVQGENKIYGFDSGWFLK